MCEVVYTDMSKSGIGSEPVGVDLDMLIGEKAVNNQIWIFSPFPSAPNQYYVFLWTHSFFIMHIVSKQIVCPNLIDKNLYYTYDN